MRLPTSRYTIIVALLFGPIAVHAEDVIDYKLIVVDYKQVSVLYAPVQSAADLSAFLDRRKGTATPFNYLSPAAKQRFLASLTFNENGVTGFYYHDLEAELVDTQIYEILSLFGIQHLAPMLANGAVQPKALMASKGYANEFTDHVGYSCEKRATCVRDDGHICVTGC